MKQNKINIAFLFGSGISVAAKMPTSTELTEMIIKGEKVKYENGRYVIREEVNPLNDYIYISQILQLLKIINKKINLFHYDTNKIASVNYEEIYFVLNEIENSLSGEIENPCLSPFTEQIRNEIKPFLISNDFLKRHISFEKIIEESLNYIKDMVKTLLSEKDKSIDYLNFLKEFSSNHKYSKLFIYTLNHDLLLEKYFRKSSIKFVDGFEEPDSQHIRYWNTDLFEKNKIKTELFKLHGSIDWYRLSIDGAGWLYDKVGICLDGNIDRSKRENGKAQSANDNRPLILVGSFNKLKEYLSGVFLYLHLQLYTKLSLCDTLIISGYGFQDKGINTRIIEWVYSSEGKKILVINPSINELKEKSNGAIANKWDGWRKQGILKTMERMIEYVDYQEIIKALESSETYF